MKTAYVYKWTHLPTLDWYVGSRTAKNAHPNDGYICSSQYVLEQIKLNPSDWKREVIAIGTPIDMYELESEILQSVDARNDMRSFNKHNNISGYSFFKSRLYVTEATRKKRSDSIKKSHANPEVCKKISDAGKGRKLSDEQKQMIRIRQTGSGNCMYGKVPESKGKHTSDEHKLATQQGMLKKWQDPTYAEKVKNSQNKPEIVKKRSESVKKSHANPNVRYRIGTGMRGKMASDATKEKQRNAKLGKPRKVTILTCPHCNMVGADSQMTRWHFDNCKFKEGIK